MRIPKTTPPVAATTQAPAPEVPAVEDNALTVLGNDLMAAAIPTGGEDLLPQMKTVYPIEIGPDSPFKMADAYHLGFYDGSSFTRVSEPFTVAAIASRNAARLLVEDESGEKKYDRAMAPLSGPPSDDYVSLVKEGAEKGASFIVAILLGGKVSIAQFDTFKTALSYWGRPLATTNLKQKIGLKVDIVDHQPNLTKSKGGNMYLDPKKFKQWSQVQLTAEQIKAVAEALAIPEIWGKFKKWMEA